jgi:hypothetical protein
MRQKNKYMLMLTFPIIAIAAAFSILACSRAPSRIDVVKTYEATVNSSNVDSLMALFDNNAAVYYRGMATPLKGKDEIRARAEYDTTLHSILTLTLVQAKKDTVFCQGREIDDWNKSARISPYVYSSFKFAVRAGKITYIRAEMADSTIKSINEVMALLLPWVQENRPATLDTLMAEGEFAFNAESARLMMSLLGQWRASRSEK